jgi:hypothetical protein
VGQRFHYAERRRVSCRTLRALGWAGGKKGALIGAAVAAEALRFIRMESGNVAGQLDTRICIEGAHFRQQKAGNAHSLSCPVAASTLYPSSA